MKIVKRDGRIVEYDPDKIRIAIGKANAEVEQGARVSEKQIDEIIKYIEKLNKKRMLVEDIQDIIEEKLMGLKKYDLAKHYIIYRYTRALVRKSNTTDETILSIIKNPEDVQNDISRTRAKTIASQRDLIAGEISKDLTKRMLLPEKIVLAHEDGAIYFHDADFFLQPMINSSIVNIKDMLDNTTVINGKLIESPNGFQVACTVMTQIIASIASGQYGELTINTRHLAKYLRKSYDKYKTNLKEKYGQVLNDELIKKLSKGRAKDELISGVQTIEYQINTLMTTNGRDPSVTLILDLEEDEYIEENANIIEEILKQTLTGVRDSEGNFITQQEPNLIYIVNELNKLNGKYGYLTTLAIKCAQRRFIPAFVSSKKLNQCFLAEDIYIPYKDEHGNNIMEGRFNQGVVTINLPQIGLFSKKDENVFFEELDNRLDLCFEALMCRNHALLGTLSDTSPIHYIYGGISRIEPGEKIDKFLKSNYSTLSLGYLGIHELVRYMKNESEEEEFKYKVLKKLKDTVDKWRKETGLGFLLYSNTSNNLCKYFAKLDRDKYGSIKDITNKGYYTENYSIDSKNKMDIYEKLKLEQELGEKLGLVIKQKVDISHIKDEQKLQEIVDYAYYNNPIIQFERKMEG